MPIQLRLFDSVTFNFEADVKELMASLCDESGLSRAEIVCRMNALARRYGIHLVKGNGDGLSVATLEKWLNPNDTTHFPSVKALTIFCSIMGPGGKRIFNVMIRPLGFQVIDSKESALLEWAKQLREIEQNKKKLKRLAAGINGGDDA